MFDLQREYKLGTSSLAVSFELIQDSDGVRCVNIGAKGVPYLRRFLEDMYEEIGGPQFLVCSLCV